MFCVQASQISRRKSLLHTWLRAAAHTPRRGSPGTRRRVPPRLPCSTGGSYGRTPLPVPSAAPQQPATSTPPSAAQARLPTRFAVPMAALGVSLPLQPVWLFAPSLGSVARPNVVISHFVPAFLLVLLQEKETPRQVFELLSLLELLGPHPKTVLLCCLLPLSSSLLSPLVVSCPGS